MKLFWMSWYQLSEDYRPITSPPNENVLAWWCSGQGEEGWTLCAYVIAEDEAGVKEAIKKDWPELDMDAKLRFIDQKPVYIPSDRFKAPDWAVERLEKWHVDTLVTEPMRKLNKMFNETIECITNKKLMLEMDSKQAWLNSLSVTDPLILDNIEKWTKILEKDPTEEELLATFEG